MDRFTDGQTEPCKEPPAPLFNSDDSENNNNNNNNTHNNTNSNRGLSSGRVSEPSMIFFVEKIFLRFFFVISIFLSSSVGWGRILVPRFSCLKIHSQVWLTNIIRCVLAETFFFGGGDKAPETTTGPLGRISKKQERIGYTTISCDLGETLAGKSDDSDMARTDLRTYEWKYRRTYKQSYVDLKDSPTHRRTNRPSNACGDAWRHTSTGAGCFSGSGLGRFRFDHAVVSTVRGRKWKGFSYRKISKLEGR